MTSRSARLLRAEVHKMNAMSRVRMLMAVSLMISVGVTLTPFAPQGIALAECSLPNRWPSFAKVAPRSDTVLVGTVTRIVSYWRHELPGTFAVKVADVLKGDAVARIRLSDVYTTGGCVVSWLDVRRGDRIAVALGGESNVNGAVSAVAFLSPLPRYSDMQRAGMRRLTMAQVRQALGLPATDTVPPDAERAYGPIVPTVAAVATAAIGFVSQVLRLLRAPR